MNSAHSIVRATRDYEAWLASQVRVVRPGLQAKHKLMAEDGFSFLRATFYRWAQLFPALFPKLARAPKVLGVGDLHVENFGTWRDAEGRLVWGVNDFDEACPLPYTNDLVRLATSALVAREYHDLRIDGKEAVSAILDGYREALERGGHAFVLAEHHTALREMALYRLHDPETFWDKLESLPTVKTPVPNVVLTSLRRALPEGDLKVRIVHRVAGLGSLGRQRFVALAVWRGGRIAREAKALAPSALSGAAGTIHYAAILRRGVRCPDPCVRVDGAWLVRRLAPDCSRVRLNELPRKRDEARLLSAMGWETANTHLGSPRSGAIRADLKRRDKHWLRDAARRLADAIDDDWREWCKAYP